MTSEKQTTLAAALHFEGIGLHTGTFVHLSILPAAANHGYVFKRVDLPAQPLIPALLENVNYTVRGTVLEKNNVKVSTTEHLLAALYALQIDNALIELDGSEVPILDGSALPYVQGIEKIGIKTLEAPRVYFELKENIKFEMVDKGVEFLAVPDPEFRVTVMVDYNSPILGTQHAQMLNIGEFKKEIAHCRTFVFLRELEQLADLGLIKGGNVDNAVVLVDREVSQNELDALAEKLGRKEKLAVQYKGVGLLNSSDLRELNEPARHKLLDIVGDLALLGKPIKAHILAARPGHLGNTTFGKVLLEQFKNQQKKEQKIQYDPAAAAILDSKKITDLLPHRYPFLLVDKVIELSAERILAIKNVTINEPFFVGHFPGEPIMPGVLQLEAMAQVAGILMLNQLDTENKYSTYFLSIDGAKFRQKVVPGDVLAIEIVLEEPIRRGIAKVKGRAFVNGQLVSEAILMAKIAKQEN